MKSETTEAIVLRRTNYGEADRIIQHRLAAAVQWRVGCVNQDLNLQVGLSF